MTTANLAALLGARAHLPIGEGVMVEVYIADVKERWGRLRYLIRPVAGYGTKWVENLEVPGANAPVEEGTP